MGFGYGNPCKAYFVYSPTCPHCHEMMPYIQMIDAEQDNLHVEYIDSSKTPEFVRELSERYNTTNFGVPRFFIGDKVFIGYAKARGELEYDPVYKAYIGYQNQVSMAIFENLGLDQVECEGIESPLYEQYPQYSIFLLLLAYLVAYPILVERVGKRAYTAGFISAFIILFFIFISLTPEQYIKEFAGKFPFPMFVFIISLADGFNPCAFTVLVILLSLLTHTNSKHKMALVGGVFVVTSAVMYFIFIVSLMMLGSWVFGQYGEIILKVLGGIVLIAGAINLKDYFFFKKGISLSLSSDQQMKITGKAREVVRNIDMANSKKALGAAIVATIGLAVFVNLVELGCTAILPAVYMAALFQSFGQHVGVMHILYTALYSIVYVIPLFAILFNFIYYFKSERITKDQGRLLKLAGGLLMIVFGIIMLFRPTLLMF
ncbi:MAG TPA: glutaredoxin family protein [Candidatus Altiarchaeales archaeon]|nr:glutaredoxin family protein [Candidatus Altiarchaeales archaeon]